MTTDIANQQEQNLKVSAHTDNCVKSDYNSEYSKPSFKRSFDVAFLMMPDERIQQRQMKKQLKSNDKLVTTDFLPPENTLLKNNSSNSDTFHSHEERHHSKITIESSNMYDDAIILPEINHQKSAFTKVLQGRLESPVPSISPDRLSRQSISPPTCPTTSRSNGLYQSFHPEYQFNDAFQSVTPPHAVAAHQLPRIKHLMFRPMSNTSSTEILHGYMPNEIFSLTGSSNLFVPQTDVSGIARNPAAAALLSTLIPPTLASTFSLTAQNVCAKCNISFRMTSDLVYHMRSHHKSEVSSDPNRRRREEKLKCTVCNESFRERHHLTRHMTAHQDKESDQNNGDKIPQRKK